MWSQIVKKDVKASESIVIKHTPTPSRTGLINQKNDCFLHCLLQMMCTLPGFKWDLDNDLCQELFKLSKSIYSDQLLFPTRIHELITNYFPNFLQKQQDVTECYYMIIDKLHELLRVDFSSIEEDEWQEIGFKSKIVQKRVYSFHNSPFKVFYGQTCNILSKKGKKMAKSIEPFLLLTVDLYMSLQSYLDTFTYSLTTDKYFTTLPDILSIQYPRFYFNKTNGPSKNSKSVVFTLDLSIPYYESDTTNYHSYKLYSVIYHIGKTIESGHYTVALFDFKLKSWIYIDDTTVYTISQEQVLNYRRNEAYMLIYVKQ